MMKLYYSPGACSLGIHVLLEEIGKPFEAVRISTREGAHLTPEYRAINPKAKVPALALEDGRVVTEYPAISFYLARSNPEAGLLPAGLDGEIACLSLLEYITGTVHPMGFTRQFRPSRFARDKEDEARVIADGKAAAQEYVELLARQIAGPWAFGEVYTVADPALFFIEQWCRRAGIEMPGALAAHHQRMLDRPAVQRALAREAA
ncbi:MAG: glutathione S-transferase N-terminal domain-containing protein [Rhodovarius sp.]|nr:glutathione S-transferase N-terminal domain-containing protein [Rhodovarius sp.]